MKNSDYEAFYGMMFRQKIELKYTVKECLVVCKTMLGYVVWCWGRWHCHQLVSAVSNTLGGHSTKSDSSSQCLPSCVFLFRKWRNLSSDTVLRNKDHRTLLWVFPGLVSVLQRILFMDSRLPAYLKIWYRPKSVEEASWRREWVKLSCWCVI